MARRTGDRISISGDYQYRALHDGPAVQRFWHFNKQLTIARYLPPRAGDLVLDVGCGSGVVADFLARSGARVIGIDANEAALAFARRTFPAANLTFQRALVDGDLGVDRPVDKIYCLEVIEHVYPPQALAMLREFHACLVPGGAIYLTTPNGHSAWPLIESAMRTLRLAPPMADAQHVASYSRASLARLCESAGFIVDRVTTTCLVAPWIAPISWAAACRLNTLETGGAFGCILVCVARRADR